MPLTQKQRARRKARRMGRDIPRKEKITKTKVLQQRNNERRAGYAQKDHDPYRAFRGYRST